jgi:D-alanyl-D-alanine dipeptidase
MQRHSLKISTLTLALAIAGCATIQQDSDQHITLIADPKVLAISVKENHERMIDLRHNKIIAYGPSPEIENNKDYIKMRKTVYRKLVEAQKLLPKGMKLSVYEAYRSIALQQMLFDKYYARMKDEHPNFTHEELFKETIKLVSPVVNLDGTKNVPPHSTGAAIDVYLVDDKGNVVDMGIETKDWADDLDGSISITNSEKISEEAKKNRKIMSDVLTAVGFVNYPTEYWHWSYGDRYWAYMKKEKHALYGSL